MNKQHSTETRRLDMTDGGRVPPHQGVARQGASDKNLPQPARRILEAARTILRDEGFAAMSLQAVAREAGQNKPAIAYYFGNKAGLIASIAESMNSEVLEFSRQAVEALAGEEDIIAGFADALERNASDRSMALEFHEILPAIVRDDQMRASLVEIYRSAHEYNAEIIGSGHPDASDEEVRAMAVLSSALYDGLAIQALIGVGDDLVKNAFAKWGDILLASL